MTHTTRAVTACLLLALMGSASALTLGRTTTPPQPEQPTEQPNEKPNEKPIEKPTEAQPAPAESGQPGQSGRPGGGALGGPRVVENTPIPTLIERDAAGRLVRLEERPETAAIRKLKLDEPTRAAIDKALVARSARLSQVLQENYALFLELQGARQAGLGRDGEAGRKTLENIRTLRDAATDLFDPPLRQSLGGLLSAELRSQFDRMVDQYREALMAEPPQEGRRPRPAGAVGGRMAEQRYETEMVLREIARTLNTEVEMRREQTDALVAAVGADPEQEAEIRRIIRTNNEGSLGNPEKARANRDKAMREVFTVLRPEQREALTKYLRENRRGGRSAERTDAPAPSATPSDAPAPVTPMTDR